MADLDSYSTEVKDTGSSNISKNDEDNDSVVEVPVEKSNKVIDVVVLDANDEDDEVDEKKVLEEKRWAQFRGNYVMAVYGLPKFIITNVQLFLSVLDCQFKVRPHERNVDALYLHFTNLESMVYARNKLNNKMIHNHFLTVKFVNCGPETSPEGTFPLSTEVSFICASYCQQVTAKECDSRKALENLEDTLYKNCAFLRPMIDSLKTMYGGPMCGLGRVLECEPINDSTYRFIFWRQKTEMSRFIKVGLLNMNDVVSASEFKGLIPPHVIQITKVLEKMLLSFERRKKSFLYKVFVYTNRAHDLMLVLELDSLQIEFEYEIRHFFTKNIGRTCNIASLYIMDNQTSSGDENIVLGSPFIREIIADFQVLLTPSIHMWSDFVGAERLCAAIAMLLAPSHDTTVLEIGCSTAVVGLYLTRLTTNVISMDIEPVIRIVKRNSKLNNCNISTYSGEPTVALNQALKSQEINYNDLCTVMTFSTNNIPDAEFVKQLRGLRALRRLVLVAESQVLDSVILMLGKITGNTEPMLPVRVVPIDTMPFTSRYVMLVLLQRTCDINLGARERYLMRQLFMEEQENNEGHKTRKKHRRKKKRREDGYRKHKRSAASGGEIEHYRKKSSKCAYVRDRKNRNGPEEKRRRIESNIVLDISDETVGILAQLIAEAIQKMTTRPLKDL